jgi:MinD-like ATPase involved in chromosome partitioning or flagellar assembly
MSQLESLRAMVGARPPAAHRAVPHVVVVAGGKGGVGVSTTSVLLAMGAAAAGHETLLVDAAPASALADVLALPSPVREDAAPGSPVYRRIARRMTIVDLTDAAALTAAERRMSLRRVASGYDNHEFVVIDAGATSESVVAALTTGAGRLLSVGTTDRLSVVATYALVKYVRERFAGLPISVLFNRCDPAEGSAAFGRVAVGVEEFLGATVTPAGTLPNDERLRAAAEAGTSPENMDGPAVIAARLLAELLIARPARRGGPPVHVLQP